jgi:hypothetical protein
VEGATIIHAKQILRSVFKLVGRDCDTFLEDTIPTMIKYLDFAFCDKQHTMCEELVSLAAQVRTSQTELQANERSLEQAMCGLLSYAQNPTKSEVYEITVKALDEALSSAQHEQQQLIQQALSIAKKICGLYESVDLSPAAQYCMSLYNLFMDLINPFIYPFKYSKAQLDLMHTEFDAKMKHFSGMLLSNNVGLCFQTHPQSWYMHCLAFHAVELQMECLRKFSRPLASFAMQQCEYSNKVKKGDMVSLYSFTNRPVGNSKCPAPGWKNKNGFLIARRRVTQLYYSFLIGRLRNPYQCGNCGDCSHNAGSKQCPINIISNGMEEDANQNLQDIDELLT